MQNLIGISFWGKSMKNIAIVAICDFLSKPNGGEVFLLNNLLSEEIDAPVKYFLIGMTFDEKMQVGTWQKVQIANNVYDFFPIVKVLKDKEKTHIPFRLRCVQGLNKYWKQINTEIQIDEWYIHSAEIGIPFYKKKDIPIVYHVHGDPSQTMAISRFPLFRTKFWTKLYLRIIRKTIYCSRKIIWAAERSKNLYLQKQPKMKKIVESKSCVVHSSFDMKLRIDNELSLNLNSERKHLITVGRLSRVKHIDFLIDVLYRLLEKNEDVDLIVCGDGEEKDFLMQYAKKLGVEDKVIFLGAIDRPTLATALNQSELFLFASENEAMSLVILESLYMGTPVVSTDVGDIPYAVKEGYTGKLVDSYNIEAYVAAVIEMLNLGKAVYSNNCKTMAMNFTPKKMAENIARELLS